MLVLTGGEMQELEQKLLRDLEIPPLLLMENAGSRILEFLKGKFGPLKNKRVHILAGPGNNGGDGLVVARQLLAVGAKPRVSLIGDGAKLSPLAGQNLEILKKLGVTISTLENKQLPQFKFALGLADLIIDAILGTGFRGSLSKELAALAELVNEIKRPVVSVDIPTGVDSANGQVGSSAVRADYTVNLGAAKVGNFLYPGREYAGENVVLDLGLPLAGEEAGRRFLAGGEVMDLLPPRPAWGHKGTFGHVLVVAGSKNMAGAAALSAKAALRAGAGLVTAAVPAGISGRFLPEESMVVPLPETKEGSFGKASLPHLLKLLFKKNALVIGPGLSRNLETIEVVQELLKAWPGPAVIDADALGALTDEFMTGVGEKKRKQWILTPHPGEMGRLLNLPPAKVNADRLGVGGEFVKKWGVVLVLKGAPTITFNGEKTYINTTGNHGLATGGTGDVLAGLVGALLAQGVNPPAAAVLGVYVHGLAGDLAGAGGRRGLIASDCLKKIQEILL
ncbi:MAG TPA: NAD(P)H-hydrate dehydratase [Firmicutes bacterium]|nr:NAD(P)H-hydrate dehydratase [Bacillota bacterium]